MAALAVERNTPVLLPGRILFLALLHTDDELHHLFFIAEILRVVVGGAQVALLRDEVVHVIAQQGRHRRLFPVRVASQPLVLFHGQSDGYTTITGQFCLLPWACR